MNNPCIPASKNINEKNQVHNTISNALVKGYAIALWRLPNEQQQHLVLSKTKRTIQTDEPFEELREGFLIAPFLPNASRTFLPADYYFRYENKQLLPPLTRIESDSHTWLAQQTSPIANSTNHFHTTTYNSIEDTSPEYFIQVVKEGIDYILRGTFEKVVPSRIKNVVVHQSTDLTAVFDALCNRYPNAMVSLISVPELGTWLGATPELLVGIKDGTTFRTVALAGTKPFQNNVDLKNVTWTQKEIEEQALVERYIISCFKKIRVREYEEHGPKTNAAGNLLHLKSDFTVDLKTINFPQLGSVMLRLLHPTSAVCGMPMQSTIEFLLQKEQHNRELYSGYLGPVNIQGNSDLYVNLRCMQWFGDHARLYAGAGVTADSIAENEWDETEIKMNTILSVVGAVQKEKN